MFQRLGVAAGRGGGARPAASVLNNGLCQLNLDVNDTAAMTLRNVVDIVSQASTQYLYSTAGTGGSDFNFQSDGVTTKACSSFWVWFETFNGGVDTALFGKVDSAFANSSIVARTAAGIGKRLDFTFAGQALALNISLDGTAGNVTLQPRKWYHFAWAYDGSQATDATKFRVWVNGVKQTNDNAPGLPQKLTNNVSAANSNRWSIGAGGGYTAYTKFAGKFADFGLWDSKTFTAASDADALSFYNSGAGINVTALADLPAGFQTPLAYWRMNETSGTRTDLSGNARHLTENNPCGYKQFIRTWTDKSPLGLSFTFGTPTTLPTIQQRRDREGRYEANWFGSGKAGIVYNNYTGAICAVSNWNNNSTGNLFFNLAVMSFAPAAGAGSGGEEWYINSGDSVAGTSYWLQGMYGAPTGSAGNSGVPGIFEWVQRLRMASNPNGQIDCINRASGAALVPGNYYLYNPNGSGNANFRESFTMEFSQIGTAASDADTDGDFRILVNGAQQDLYENASASPIRGWADVITSRNYLGLGTFTSDGANWQTLVGAAAASNPDIAAFGDVVSFGPTLTATDRATMRSYLMARR